MNVVYTFKITALHVIPELNGLNNIVQRISWRITGEYVSPEGKVIQEPWDGTTTIKLNSEIPFLESGELNEDIVKGWVEEIENKKQRNLEWIKVNEINKRISDKISLSTPKIVKPFWEQQQ